MIPEILGMSLLLAGCCVSAYGKNGMVADTSVNLVPSPAGNAFLSVKIAGEMCQRGFPGPKGDRGYRGAPGVRGPS